MLNIFGKTKLKAFGLDISDVAIKVLELSKKDSGYYPLAFAEVPLTANIIANHMITNPEKLAENIKRAVAVAKHMDTKYVVASVPESKSFVRVLKLFKMPEDEIAGALPYELEQNIPVPIDLVYMDWQLIGEVGDQLEVLVTATPKDYVDTLITSLKHAGLKPIALELESQAMARSLISKEDKQASVMIVDLSSIQTSFLVVEMGNVTYTSSIPVAGNAFSESIARNLSIPLADAEKAKREQGLLGDIKKGNIRQAMLPLLDNIIDEIKNVAKFHGEHSRTHTAIAKIILCGGSSKLPGISDYISARLNLGTTRSLGQVTLGNPWVNIADITKRKFPISGQESLGYATAAGLAMRGAGNI
jgi:type IV pilus assembly protein PilM